MNYLWGALVVMAAVFAAPIGIARFLAGGQWSQIAIAYAAWFALLIAVLGSGSSTGLTEKFNWIALAAVVLSFVAVPLFTLLQRAVGWALSQGG